MLRILYIAGYGRSGSTILDMALSTLPRVVGTGELTHLFTYWARGKMCSCQRAFSQCEFWSGVLARTPLLASESELLRAEAVTRRVERTPWGWWAGPRGISRAQSQYRDIWCSTLEAIAAVADAEIIVDSSKSTRLVSSRAAALKHLCGLDVRVIHLVRDPRAVMWSYLRGSNIKLEQGQRQVKVGGPWRMLPSWIVTNVGVHVLSLLADLPTFRLRYEDLTDPALLIQAVGGEYGRSFQGTQDWLTEKHPLSPGHGVGGNRLRRAGSQSLRLDREWERMLPISLRWLALLSWPLLRAYGYSTLLIDSDCTCGSFAIRRLRRQ